MSYNEDAAIRRAAVWALGEMAAHRKDAYLSVVRRLVDNDRETREEAKHVLKALTGISYKICRATLSFKKNEKENSSSN